MQDFISIEALKNTRADVVVKAAVSKLRLLNAELYELAETFSSGGQIVKERRLLPDENPVRIQLLWPRVAGHIMDAAHRTHYHFFLRKKEAERPSGAWVELSSPNPTDSFLSTFLQQPSNREYPDLCNLPDLNERTLLVNLQQRFLSGHIYTYVGSILIAVNPFKFLPYIYNPKYINMYQNRRLGELPPHIFAMADTAYHNMLSERTNQCIVITGESGSGKTESTNLLLNHLSALSRKGLHPGGSGLEQGILGAGPVLEVSRLPLSLTRL
jgi:myosin-9